METGQVNERFHAEKEMVMETLFVIGAGTMGGGIAQVAALNGFTVYLYDIKQEFVDKGLKGIAGAWDKLVARGKMAAEDRDAALPRIIGTLDMQDAAKADVVIEAAVEDLDVKRSIFSKLDGIVSPGCILATNTSSLSVTAVASAVGSPDKVVGLHFFNPVPRMALIEIIRGAATSDETYEAAKALSERLGKTAVTVNEYPGFVVNRILIPMINEAVFMLQEGVASAEDIDTAMKLGANHPMGPLALARPHRPRRVPRHHGAAPRRDGRGQVPPAPCSARWSGRASWAAKAVKGSSATKPSGTYRSQRAHHRAKALGEPVLCRTGVIMREVVIVSAARTALGSFGGSLASVPAVELGAVAIRAALSRGGVDAGMVEEVVMGNVLQAGLGQNPARQAAVKAGIPVEIPAWTVNKVCGSGLKAVAEAALAIRAGEARCVVAGGMENMSQASYVLPSARWGGRMGDAKLVDEMIRDGLWDAFNDYHMGITAENVAGPLPSFP